MSKKRVFISYSRDDRAFVEKLVDSLRENGLEVWLDVHLRSGEDWDDALESQIIGTDHMIIVLSETSAASDNVKNEMRFALDKGKQIHPILYKPCSVPLSMRRMHYIDFTALDYDKALQRLVQDIKTEKSEIGKTSSIRESGKKKGKSKLKFVFGLVAIVIISITIWKFSSKSSEEPKTNEVVEVVDDINWRKIDISTDVYEYTNYISSYKNTENKLKTAVKTTQDMLKDEGAIVLNREDFFDWFYKLAYLDDDGYYVANDLANKNLSWPQNGDLLIAQKPTLVMNPATLDIMPGVFIEPGAVIQFSESQDENNGQTFLKFYFIKNEAVKPDPLALTKTYISKFDYKSKISSSLTEAEVWHFLSTENEADEFEGYLWYLEHYGFDSRFSEKALNTFLDDLNKIGYVIYSDGTIDDKDFKSIMTYDGNAIVFGEFDHEPRPGDLAICTINRGSPVYKGIYGLHEDHGSTGDWVRKDELVFIMDNVVEANQRKYVKVKYREY